MHIYLQRLCICLIIFFVFSCNAKDNPIAFDTPLYWKNEITTIQENSTFQLHYLEPTRICVIEGLVMCVHLSHKENADAEYSLSISASKFFNETGRLATYFDRTYYILYHGATGSVRLVRYGDDICGKFSINCNW